MKRAPPSPRAADMGSAADQRAAEQALGPRSTGLDLMDDDPFDGVAFSPTLEAAIADVIPSEDELDRADFNATAYINKLFPTEESLLNVEPFMDSLRGKIAQLDGEIMDTVRLQTTGAGSARAELEGGKAAIQELFLRVQDIKRKAEQSEDMVHEICADIKALDLAKRHLTTTITALKRLQMLSSAVEQLGTMCRDRLYRDAAHLLLAVSQLSVHFDGFRGIAKVDALRDAIGGLRAQLRRQIFDDVNRLGAGGGAEEGGGGGGEGADAAAASAHALEQLGDACAAVDALGELVVREMLCWFCNLTFAPYRHIFHPYGDGGSLERTEVRYTWLRQALKKYAARYAPVFPASWQVPCVLAVEFCKVTRVHLAETLQEAGRQDTLQVAVLTHALVKTIDFEAEMQRLFGATAARIAAPDFSLVAVGAAAAAADGGGGGAEPAAASGGGGADGGAESSAPASPRARADSSASAPPGAPACAGFSFVGCVSSVFGEYMGLYVQLEAKGMAEGVRGVLAQERWAVPEDLAGAEKETRVLRSSIDLFLLIKRALKRCVPVSTGDVLLRLHGVWRDALCSYAAAVGGRLPRVPQVASGWEPPAVHLSDEELTLICAAVTTCEYCAATSGELEESIRRQIAPELAEQVSMAAAQDAFQGAITAAVKLLVADVETGLHAHLLAYTRVKWAELEDVSEESTQMNSILRKLGKVAEFWGAHLLPLYVRFTCDKLVTSFVPRFVQMIHRCRRLGETGAQQVLLDLQALKSCLLELPAQCGTSGTSAYTKLVSAEVGKAEQLLRLVLTPEEALTEHFDELAAGLGGAGVDLGRVLELKGVRKPEMTASAINLLEDIKGGVSTSAANASLTQSSAKIKKLLNIS